MNREFKDLEQKKDWAAAELRAVLLRDGLSEGDARDYEDAVTSFLSIAVSEKNPEHVLEVLKMVLNGHLLAPIEDKEEEFVQKGSIYLSKRWPYLHYRIDEKTGERTIIDTKAALTVDINNPREYLFEPFAIFYFYHMCHKLEFPYMPPEEPWAIYIEKCNAYGLAQGGEYDTLAICYAKLPDQNQLMEIKKYFKRNFEDDAWTEIEINEYAFRCKKAGVLDE